MRSVPRKTLRPTLALAIGLILSSSLTGCRTCMVERISACVDHSRLISAIADGLHATDPDYSDIVKGLSRTAASMSECNACAPASMLSINKEIAELYMQWARKEFAAGDYELAVQFALMAVLHDGSRADAEDFARRVQRKY
jgi:hypothetical protein